MKKCVAGQIGDKMMKLNELKWIKKKDLNCQLECQKI